LSEGQATYFIEPLLVQEAKNREAASYDRHGRETDLQLHDKVLTVSTAERSAGGGATVLQIAGMPDARWEAASFDRHGRETDLQLHDKVSTVSTAERSAGGASLCYR